MDGAPTKTSQLKFRKIEYRSPHHAQVWFLCRSRDCWKRKYMALKKEQRRLDNRDRDVTKSRDSWAEQARQETARARKLEQENEALKRELEDLKKSWLRST